MNWYIFEISDEGTKIYKHTRKGGVKLDDAIDYVKTQFVNRSNYDECVSGMRNDIAEHPVFVIRTLERTFHLYAEPDCQQFMGSLIYRPVENLMDGELITQFRLALNEDLNPNKWPENGGSDEYDLDDLEDEIKRRMGLRHKR